LALTLPRFGRRSAQAEQLVLAWDGRALAYVQARHEAADRYRVQRFGVLRPEAGKAAEELARQFMMAGLRGKAVRAMLRPAQYQMLQIEAPAVPPEELKTAARWQIRDMAHMHLDDLTLDVLKVGDERVRASGSVFVVAAANAVIRELMQTAQAARCSVDVIDIQDLAQRNLQSAQARRLGTPAQAHAAIVMTDDSHALLTICAHEELFYTRRIDLGAGFLQQAWGEVATAGMGGEDGMALSTGGQDGDLAQRLVVEIQRSLDLWDRTWPMLALNRVSVQAGARTDEMAAWLTRELGQTVVPLDVAAMFPGFEGGSEADRQLCWPLLGVLLRDEGRRL
jgi:MSHA biogenesis protein MshI